MRENNDNDNNNNGSGNNCSQYSSSLDSKYMSIKKAQNSIITKASKSPQKTSTMLVAKPSAPPVGSYNLPTLFDDNSYDKKASASFLSSGRSSAFVSNNTTNYKSMREEIALTNLGPGSYNLAYTWRTDKHNNRLSPTTSTELRSDSPSTSCSSPGKLSPSSSSTGQHERPWVADKQTIKELTARQKKLYIADTDIDIESIKSLPSY